MHTGQDFDSFIEELLSISTPNEFRSYIEKNTENNNSVSISKDFRKIEHTYQNIHTGEWITESYYADEEIFRISKFFVNKAPTKIVRDYGDKEQIKRYLNMIRVALKSIDKNDFFKSFPYYRHSLVLLGNTLKNIQETIDKPVSSQRQEKVSQQGDKLQLVFELEEEKQLLESSESHQEAVDLLKERHPEFEWDDNNHELFFFNKGGLKGSQASIALEKVAKIKFGEDKAPNREYIRAYLFKST